MNISSNDWSVRRIDEIASINPHRPASLRGIEASELVTFVPMAAVNAVTGEIDQPEYRSISEVSKGFTYFENNDVLFAKITPCMQNGKSAIARNLCNGIGFGTTEFHVIRCNPELVVPEWLWYYVRQQSFRDEATRHFRGSAGQQRVPADFIASHCIPVPSLCDQKRILSSLKDCIERVNEISVLHQQNIEDIWFLKRSLVFGEKRSDRTWRELSELVEWVRDTETVSENETYQFAGAKSFGKGLFHSATRTGQEFKYKDVRRLQHRDFTYPKLMAWEGAFGMVPKELDGFVVSPEFVVFRTKGDICPEVLDTYFRSPLCLDDVRNASTGSNKRRRRLNPQAFLKLKVPVPPHEAQEQLKKVYEFEAKAAESWKDLPETLEKIRQGILKKAFAGEL